MFHVLNVYLECLFQNKSFIFEQIKYSVLSYIKYWFIMITIWDVK